MTRLLLCACLVSLAFAQDICKTSVGQKWVDGALAAAAEAQFTGLTSVASVQTAMNTLYNSIATYNGVANVLATYGSVFGGVGIGLANNDFYGIVHCDSSEVDCDSDGGFTYVVRNMAVYSSASVYFYFDRNHMEVGNSTGGSGAFTTTTRPWYTQTDGWSTNPAPETVLFGSNAETARNAYVYKKALASSAGVLVGWRFAWEPCGTCYVPTFPPKVAVSHAAFWAPREDSVTDIAGFQTMIDFLLPYVVNNTASGSSFSGVGYINFIVGYYGGQSYMIKDCGLQNGGGSFQCTLNSARYQLWLTSPPVFGVGNDTRLVYAIDANGKLGQYLGLGNSAAAPTGTYVVSTRGFYLAQDGWTFEAPVIDFSATLDRRFVVASKIDASSGSRVVVGGEFIDNGPGVCTSDASSIRFSVFAMVVVALLACL